MASPLYIRTLVRAAQALGGERELARRLGVRLSRLHLWLAHIEPVPQSVFLRAVDIVMCDDASFFDGELPPPLGER